MRRLLLCLLVAGVGTFGFARIAAAYPQFQFSSGTNKCSQCHYSPAGGGLLSSWGRSESGDTISMGGDGSFLHGAATLPSWFAAGVDLRLAATRQDDGGDLSPSWAWFPMQADLYTRFAFGDAFSLYIAAGAKGETRPVDNSVGSRLVGNLGDRFISREHYLMWRPSATGPYARVGRFYAPYGLRFVEHIYFVRRYAGYQLYNETYTASGGYVSDEWELHVSAFTPPPTNFPDALQSVGARESGGAGYFEYRLNGMAALAGQARVGIGKEASRYQGGAVGKLWIEKAKLLFLGEADFIHQVVDIVGAPNFNQNQFVSYLGVSAFPVRGIMISPMYERYQENLSVRTTGRNAYNLQINVFPYAHCEVVLFGQYMQVGQQGQPAATLLMGQLHYYL
ncbi:MAG TPA: hypothetical protein VN903_24420 [Polyangia bacterium]|jgi:hypothetical protein|nr:hypothetical protein [Polyangia bacterium]